MRLTLSVASGLWRVLSRRPWLCNLLDFRVPLGGNGPGISPRDFLLGAKPVIEIVTIFPAAGLIEFVRAAADLFFEILGLGTSHREGLSGIVLRHGETPVS
jgi:hypothetical protein